MKLKLNLEIDENVLVPTGGPNNQMTKKMLLKIADCEAVLTDDEGKAIGSFGGAFGGTYYIEINGHEFHIPPKMIYNAICEQFGLKSMQ